MKFLWNSNAPWAGTGYGQQTRLMLKALKGLGHQPRCFAFYGLSGGMVEYDGYPVYPNSDFETWGNDTIKMHVDRSRSDLLVTLMDLFVLNRRVYSELPVPWAPWVPLDSEGIGPDTLRPLEIAPYPVAMSDFGAEQMRKHDVEPAARIYHAVDTDIFKPLEKHECREELDLDPDSYIVGMVMANKGNRKMFPLQLKAIKRFFDDHKDEKMYVYLHTEPTPMMGGWDMPSLVELSGLKGRALSTNQYDVSVVPCSPELMAKIYNSFDVLVNCSMGEGFGIPIIEAQACGVPVVTHGVTAMPEITVNGYTVESVGTEMVNHMGWQFIPSAEDITYRLECVYRMNSVEKADLGRDFVIQNCSVPVIAAQWSELFRKIGQDQRDTIMASRRWIKDESRVGDS